MVAVCGVSELLKQLDIAVGQRTKQTVISPHGCSLGHDQLTSKFFFWFSLGFFGFFLGFLWGKIGAKLIGLILGSIGVNLGQFLIGLGVIWVVGWVGFSLARG